MMSRQFWASLKFGAVYAVLWGVIGTVLGLIGAGPIWPALFPSLVSYGVIFGTIGGLSGLSTALLLARAERGRNARDVPVWRAALWGFLGGFAPGGIFVMFPATLGTVGTVWPLFALALVTGGLGALLSGGAVAAAKVPAGEDVPELPPEA